MQKSSPEGTQIKFEANLSLTTEIKYLKYLFLEMN